MDTDSNGTINSASVDCLTAPTAFDHTDVLGPNCCEGTYTLVTRAWNASTSTYVPAVTTKETWGGKAANCLKGPAMDTQTLDTAGEPTTDIYYVDGAGINKVYAIAAPIKKTGNSNIYAANYFEAVDHAGGLYAGYYAPYYSIECLDRSHEVVAAIHLQIREWNTSAEFALRKTAPTAHSSTGFEPSPFGTHAINDHRDWKDYVNNFPKIL